MDELAVAIEAARRGAAVVASAIGQSATARFKSRGNPVTEADQTSETAIVEFISSRFPEDGLVAEEGAKDDWQQGRVWVIDPLDGTVNFLHGVPQIAVSVAFWDGGEGRAGVVIDVTRGEEFSAAAGGGAFLNQTPISVSTTETLEDALVGTGFAYDRHQRSEWYGSRIEKMLRTVQDIRRAGSAALDLVWVAAGRYDAFWEEQLAPWDVAAASVIIKEAGGMVTDLEGNHHRLDASGVVASNRVLHLDLLEALG